MSKANPQKSPLIRTQKKPTDPNPIHYLCIGARLHFTPAIEEVSRAVNRRADLEKISLRIMRTLAAHLTSVNCSLFFFIHTSLSCTHLFIYAFAYNLFSELPQIEILVLLAISLAWIYHMFLLLIYLFFCVLLVYIVQNFCRRKPGWNVQSRNFSSLNAKGHSFHFAQVTLF